jgi:DNA-binding NarL/FixJ family response regulator
VLVVEDDSRARAFFEASVQRSPRLFWLGSAGTVQEALAWLARTATIPDVLLVDLGMPDGTGLDVIRDAVARFPGCEPLVVSVFGDEENVLASIEAGAVGYIHKDAAPEDIAQTIVEMKAGASPISPMIARRVLAKYRSLQSAALPGVAAGAGRRGARGGVRGVRPRLAVGARARGAHAHRARLLLCGDRAAQGAERAHGADAHQEPLRQARGALQERGGLRSDAARPAVSPGLTADAGEAGAGVAAGGCGWRRCWSCWACCRPGCARRESPSAPSRRNPIELRHGTVTTSVDGVTRTEPVDLSYHWDRRHQGRPGMASFDLPFTLDAAPDTPWGIFIPRVGNVFEVQLNDALLQVYGDLAAATTPTTPRRPSTCRCRGGC